MISCPKCRTQVESVTLMGDGFLTTPPETSLIMTCAQCNIEYDVFAGEVMDLVHSAYIAKMSKEKKP